VYWSGVRRRGFTEISSCGRGILAGGKLGRMKSGGRMEEVIAGRVVIRYVTLVFSSRN